VAFLLYLLYLVGPLVMVFASFAELQQGLAAMGRIREVLESPVEAEPSGGVAEPGVEAAPAARLDRVCFGYGPGRPVLEGVSFEIPGPGLTALVGRSGAGKSTVFALLSRFYDADSGSVQVGGTDVRHLPLNELRARVAYVEQDAPVLAGTVRQNLLYASPGASEEELEEVIDLVNLRAFVGKLPGGLDAEVGDGGTLLSGGERQRIALARMLLCKPRLLLLDEVTSQLDAENERALKETVRRVSRRCAVLVISHRLSTVVGADKILLLDGGRVSAEGTHEELLENSPLYKKLVETQMIEAEHLSSEGRPRRA
jgi:ABC-type multidrug transport system fused ATPase/permease subunit